MKKSHIIKALNMRDVEILTLDKANDRIEFETLPLMLEDCISDCVCKHGVDCGTFTCSNKTT